MKQAYIMVGLPGSGKSTIAQHLVTSVLPGTIAYLSTDSYIEAVASLNRLTYREVFADTIEEAITATNLEMQEAIANRLDLVIDNTHLSVKSRAKKLAMIPPCYQKTAIIVHRPDSAEWNRRLNSRPGKTIPEAVIHDMLASYECPTLAEGFNQIWSRHS